MIQGIDLVKWVWSIITHRRNLQKALFLFLEKCSKSWECKRGRKDVNTVGEERDMEVDCEEDSRFQALLSHLCHPMWRRTWNHWLRRHADHQFSKLRSRVPTPPDYQTRIPCTLFLLSSLFLFLLRLFVLFCLICASAGN